MFDRLFARVRPFHKYLIGAAWFFVGFSLLTHLIRTHCIKPRASGLRPTVSQGLKA